MTHAALPRIRPLVHRLPITLAAITVAFARAAHAADDDEGPAITPYRPSVSSPAQLPHPGQLEFELGGLRMSDGTSRRSSLPYLFKLAFSDEWGVLVGGDAHVWTQDNDLGRSQGVGDTTVTLKRAWIVDKESAFGMEFGVKIPTARATLGSGKTDYTINTIYSRDFGPVHMDANLNATRLGLVDAGGARTQLGASTSFSVALSKHWGLTGEVSGTHRGGVDNGLQFLTALTFSPSKRLTFDVGIAHAPRPRPAANSLFAGVVLPLGRLWQ